MKYQKRPVVIEAFRFGHEPSQDWWVSAIDLGIVHLIPGHSAKIKTLEGTMEVHKGDWIIKGIKDELYPCKHEIFMETYSPYSE